ncbi:hypothetical protein E1258_09490 [Micromonospora sp. KC207]|uniref:hypothetical protein n=1 Tax=Micromonospora sp. KC207 TaxID=2530377 RepID=UPI001051594F|nr:hypothetical protein [Micromonospora sp. KC207]TDC63869.1 hypothetical protein E1258_09490 [Micromonospora sp. KC207]
MSTPTIPSSEASEPLLSVGGITAGVTALIALVTAFGLDLSAEQQTAILGVVAVLAPLVVSLVGRGRVYSPATVRSLLAVRGR